MKYYLFRVLMGTSKVIFQNIDKIVAPVFITSVCVSMKDPKYDFDSSDEDLRSMDIQVHPDFEHSHIYAPSAQEMDDKETPVTFIKNMWGKAGQDSFFESDENSEVFSSSEPEYVNYKTYTKQ